MMKTVKKRARSWVSILRVGHLVGGRGILRMAHLGQEDDLLVVQWQKIYAFSWSQMTTKLQDLYIIMTIGPTRRKPRQKKRK